MYRSCLQIFVIARSCPMFRSRSAGSCPHFMTSVECPHLAQIQFCVRHTSLHLGEKNFSSSQNHAHVCSMPICCGSHTGGWCGAGGNMQQKDPSLSSLHRRHSGQWTRAPLLQRAGRNPEEDRKACGKVARSAASATHLCPMAGSSWWPTWSSSWLCSAGQPLAACSSAAIMMDAPATNLQDMLTKYAQ
jgi:hypothetical protein